MDKIHLIKTCKKRTMSLELLPPSWWWTAHQTMQDRYLKRTRPKWSESSMTCLVITSLPLTMLKKTNSNRFKTHFFPHRAVLCPKLETQMVASLRLSNRINLCRMEMKKWTLLILSKVWKSYMEDLQLTAPSLIFKTESRQVSNTRKFQAQPVPRWKPMASKTQVNPSLILRSNRWQGPLKWHLRDSRSSLKEANLIIKWMTINILTSTSKMLRFKMKVM